MNILGKLGIPSFSDKELEELTACKILFDTLVSTKDKRVNKVSKKRAIISDVFDLIIEHFNVGNLKIKFGENLDFDDEFVCIENISDNYEDVVEFIVRECIYRYFINLENRRQYVTEDDYKLIKLCVLNENKELIKRLSDEVINNLFMNTEYGYNFPLTRISKSKITKLVSDNIERNNNILKACCSYPIEDDLFPGQIRAVFACLSSDVFSKLNVKSKIHLMNLIYNYFNYHKDDRYNKYKKVVNSSFTNIDALNYVLYDLSYKASNNHLNKIRNEKLLEDVKTGFKYIIKNETNKCNIDKLDGVSIQNIVKK